MNSHEIDNEDRNRMLDYNKRLRLRTTKYYGDDSGGGSGGVRYMRREPGKRRLAGDRQASLYSRPTRPDGMGDRRRRGGCCCCASRDQGSSRHPLGMREEGRMTGGAGRTKTTRQRQLHVVVSPSQHRRSVLTLSGGGGGGGSNGSNSGNDSCVCCHRDGSGIKKGFRFSALSGVKKRKFKCPAGCHIHYAQSFRQDDSHRCRCEFLDCDTSVRVSRLSDAIFDIFHGKVDGVQRQKCSFASRRVGKKKATTSINRRKYSNNIGSIFRNRILFHVILLLYHLNRFSTFAYATQTSPSSLSSSSSSLLTTPKKTHYNLIPPPPSNSSSVLIHFNPPSIKDLQLNKPQTVFFNFTIYQRPWRPQSLKAENNSIVNNKNNNNNQRSKIGVTKNTNQQKTSSSFSKAAADDSERPLSDSVATPSVQATNTFLSNSNNDSGGQQLVELARPTSSTVINPLSIVQQSTTTSSSSNPDLYSVRNHSNSQPFPSLINYATPGTFQQQSKEVVQNQRPQNNQKLRPSRYWVKIYSNDANVARIKLSKSAAGYTMSLRQDSEGQDSFLLMMVTPGRQYNFSIEAKHIGRTTMSLAVVDAGGEVNRLPKASNVQTVTTSQYDVASVRGERTADVVFDSAAAAIAILISFGMGASTDIDSIKRQLKYPVSLIVGFCCQFIIMPVLAFGLAMALPKDKDIRFGLLCTACVPGGGLGHIAVIIADGDTALSMTINFISVIAMLWTAPLWIFVLGQYFETESDAALSPRMLPIFNFEVWLAASVMAYIVGLITKRYRAPIADAILMWLIKPFLLLASILYITIGVYINMYVFDMMKEFALLGAVLLPFCGCVLGAGLAALCRQGNTFVKTIALETASLNCVVVLVALRFSLRQPDADLASMIPIWVLFTTPGLFVFLSICKKVKNAALHYWRNRNSNSKKDAELLGSMKAYSVSSSAVSPPGTTTLSAPLVVADGVDDDLTISTTSNQKVTVL